MVVVTTTSLETAATAIGDTNSAMVVSATAGTSLGGRLIVETRDA